MKRAGCVVLLLLASCGSTRLYEGAELPPDQVAHVNEVTSMWTSLSPYVVEYDGRKVDHSMVSGDWDVTPGAHVLLVQARMPTPMLGSPQSGDRCTLHFTADAGVTYELQSESSETHPPFNVRIVDTRTGAVVADDEPDSAADCLSADVDWAGRAWVPTQYSTNAMRSIVVLVPEGRTIQDTDEWVELQCRGANGQAPDVDVVMGGMWEAFKDSADAPDMSVLAREEGATPGLVFTMYGADNEDRRTSALVVLRTAGNLVHALMWFKVTPAFDEAELATWRERFAQARLHEPKVR